jgi:small subunit ribosomal protein S9
MADEERNDDVTPDEQPPEDAQPAEPEAPAEEPTAGSDPSTADASEAPAADEGSDPTSAAEGSDPTDEAEEPATEEPDAGSDPSTAEASEAPPADEGSDPTEAAEEPAAQAPAAETPAAPAGAKAKDLPPGAELEPISLESERPMGAEERARLEAEAEERARIEAEATSDDADEPLASSPRVDISPDRLIQATGKRKNAIARVVVRGGSGKFEVNRRSLEEYFPRPHLQTIARQALVTCGYEGNVDITVRVHGGGVAGQAGAVRHGVARALTEIDGELRSELKRRGFLTRDARIKERRKAGLKKARKRPQFSKR